MAPFSNVNLTYQNVSFGPTAGRIHSIDHLNDVMTVKTLAGGSVSTIPLDVGILNEVLELEWDGYYFWSLSQLGALGTLGVVINKWRINDSGTSLVKQTGVGNEINLLNTGSDLYDSESFCVERYTTALTSSVASGFSTIAVGSTSFILPGDKVYIGPSSASAGEVIERQVLSSTSGSITFTTPLSVGFLVGDKAVYRKNIWVFNNKAGLSDEGSLVRVNSNNGSIVTSYYGCQYKHVTASTFNSDSIFYVRNAQLLRYKPFGANAGFQSSAALNNIEVDNETLIKIYDIEMDSANVYKLQLKQHQFNTGTFEFEDISSSGGLYNIDTEILAAKVTSITTHRDRSVLFGTSTTGIFLIEVHDQYDIPIFGRSFSIIENDTSGFISPGFTSFVTNVSGQGTTKYNTGVTPAHGTPLITAIDVATDFRLKFNVVQSPNTDGIGLVEQLASLSGRGFVEQTTLSGRTLIQQNFIDGITIVEQQELSSVTLVEQFSLSGSTQVQQNAAVESTTLIEQLGSISDTTPVEQYDFLIFALPTPYSIKNPTDTNILVRIIGFGATPLNSATLIFKVNGIDIAGDVVITPFGGGLELFYNPPVNFDYSSTVTIFISIEDTNPTPRTVTTTYTFDIVPDTKKPIIVEFFPPNKSENNNSLTEVYAIVRDLETGININSIILHIEGITVAPTITDLGDGYFKVAFQTSNPYPYEAFISSALFVEDNEGNQVIAPWTFQIEPSSGVLFTNVDPESCSVLVPIETDICVEAFGLEDGINISSLKFNISGKDIVYILQPKVYRKE